MSTAAIPSSGAVDSPARPSLSRPALPLARMVLFFQRSGAAQDAAAIIAQFPAPLEIAATVYADPATSLAFCLDILDTAPARAATAPGIVDGQGEEVSGWVAAEALVLQDILRRELESINSHLCGGRGCVLCCTGPTAAMRQQFFEVPLDGAEEGLFAGLSRIDTPGSRCAAFGDDIEAFCTAPLLVRRRPGWSLVLPKGSRCPFLDGENCAIYTKRPSTCRRPQIFPYVLEEGGAGGALVLRNALLAVWDCPYVRELQDEIASYAEACGLELFFRSNKE